MHTYVLTDADRAEAAAGGADLIIQRAVALHAAIDHLDALWELDEARGMRDGRGGAEYWRVSPAARLREMCGEPNPYGNCETVPLCEATV
jgi:hypothetical protein